MPAPAAVAAPTAAPSFETFFERERDDLYSALCLVTRDRHEAEEIAQEAFVKVLEHWERVSGMDEPGGYLYRTAMNVFRSRYRRAMMAARRTVGAAPSNDEIAAVDERDAAVRALALLSPRQRAALVLTDLLGYPSEEAARMLGIRASTLRVHVARARATLKGSIADG